MISDQFLNWLCLKTCPELGNKQSIKLLETYPDPNDFVGNNEHAIYVSGLISEKAAFHLSQRILPPNTPQILKLMEQYKIEWLNINEYPAQLRNIFAPPIILYYRGDVAHLKAERTLAVVGTRKPGAYGKEMCKKLLAPLCRQKVNIISGLALGIDTIAHKTALKEGSTSIAVLACGLENIYPSQNTELAKSITEHGVLISEYEPGTKPDKWNFPARNRIISALADLVFIVEAPINSGAMLTAKNALQQNRDLCALPGNINSINSEGPNHLIKNGAALVSNSEDLQFLLGLSPEHAKQMEVSIILNADEQKLYDLLVNSHQSLSFDEILLQSGFSIGRLSTMLTNLELKGIIAKEEGGIFFVV